MATIEQRAHARSFLKKAEEYLASAEANLTAERFTVAAGDAIHAGICAKDAIVAERTGATTIGQAPCFAVEQLRKASRQRPDAAGAEEGCANGRSAGRPLSTARLDHRREG